MPQPPAKRTPGRPRHRPLAEQREVVLSAARRVFAQHDFHGTTIERVAKEAGVARPAVYDLFGNKDELFVAVVDDAAARMVDGIEQRLVEHSQLSPRELVRSDVAAIFDFIEQQPDVAGVIRVVEYGGFGPARAEVGLVRRRIELALADLFSAAWVPYGGVSPESARLLALMTLAMVEAVGFRQPDEPAWPASDTIGFITEFIVGGLAQLAGDPERIQNFGLHEATSGAPHK